MGTNNNEEYMYTAIHIHDEIRTRIQFYDRFIETKSP